MKRQLLLLLLILMLVACVHGQRKWIGGQGSSWDNPLNWEPAGLPVITDDILLDNSQQTGNYAVTLPVNAVTIHSIAIMPAAPAVIKLVLPAANLASPALTLTSSGDALLLARGAVFQNASGLSSGQSLRITGKVRINNGGTYIHNTRSAHANDVVARLSTEDGTEEGVFEFDIPSASSTISLSNRVFGKLRLSAVAYNGWVAYSGGGSNPVTIRSDLEIGERVSFSIGFSGVFSIKRNLLQAGGSFNISNDNNASMVVIGGNILQAGGVITETGVAEPVLSLSGTEKQQLQFTGGITNQVTLRCDNLSGVILTTPLALPFRLQLRKGILHTSTNALLTISPGCELQADSVSGSFINGPLRREGLNRSPHVLFPVGNESKIRWLALKNATGNFTVSYKQENPNVISTMMGEGIHHISSIEAWTIDADGEEVGAMVELSFDNMHSGGVTDLQTLRVAQLQVDGNWKNRGNAATTGSAGAAGSVTSEPVIAWDNRERYFTLASSVSNQNILPRHEILFTGRKEGRAVRFEGSNLSDLPVAAFILETATENLNFREVKKTFVPESQNCLDVLYYPKWGEKYFRMQAICKGGPVLLSRVIYINSEEDTRLNGIVSVNSEQLVLKWHAEKTDDLKICLHDISGRVLLVKKESVKQGPNTIALPRLTLSKGMYIVSVYYKEGKAVMKLMVQ